MCDRHNRGGNINKKDLDLLREVNMEQFVVVAQVQEIRLNEGSVKVGQCK